jgi:hypothetical protein
MPVAYAAGIFVGNDRHSNEKLQPSVKTGRIDHFWSIVPT